MRKSKNKGRPPQQQSGRPVLVAFYVVQPRRVRTGATSSHDHHHRHHLHGGGYYDERRRRNGGKFPNNHRADLLEYSRQLRALARHTTTTSTVAAPPPPPSPSGCCGSIAVTREQPAAVNRRPKRATSQLQQIRHCCFGSDDGWSWKRVVGRLMLPFRSNRHSVVGRTKPSRATRMDGHDSEKKRNNNRKSWPSALLVGKLTVAKKRRDGFAKKLMSIFQKRRMDH